MNRPSLTTVRILLAMSKVVIAEYDAERQSLKLSEPLIGVRDHEKVRVAIEGAVAQDGERPWMKCADILSPEAGRQLAQAVREAFGRDEIEI